MKIALLGSSSFLFAAWVGLDVVAILIQDFILGPDTIVEPKFGVYLMFLLAALGAAAKLGAVVKEFTTTIETHDENQKALAADLEGLHKRMAEVERVQHDWNVRTGTHKTLPGA